MAPGQRLLICLTVFTSLLRVSSLQSLSETNTTSAPVTCLTDVTQTPYVALSETVATLETTTNRTNVTECLNDTVHNETDCQQDAASEAKAVSLTWVINVVVTSTVAVFGIFGNGVSVCVLASPKMKSSNSVILIFLAFFDTLILFRHILLIGLRDVLGRMMSKSRLTEIYTIPVNVIFRPFEHIGHFGSEYTTLLLTCERFVVVFFPLRAVAICTVKHARVGGFVVLLLSVVYNVPKFLGGTIHLQRNPVTNLTGFVFVTFKSAELRSFMRNVYAKYLELIFLLVLPSLILVVLNSCILYKLFRRSRQFKNSGSAVNNRLSSVTDRVTAMTLAIILTFCISLIILHVNRRLCIIRVGKSVTDLPAYCRSLNLTANFLYTFNSAVNFCYYCLFGTKFRKVLFSGFPSVFRKLKENFRGNVCEMSSASNKTMNSSTKLDSTCL